MHIDQRRETAPSDPPGKPKRRGRKGTPVVCLDTQTTFPSIRAASAWAGCSVKCIGHCVAGRTKTAGGYRWAWAEPSGRRGRTPVVCVETGERFDSVKAAATRACCAPVTLSACLACGRKTAGGRHWAYADQPAENWQIPVERLDDGERFASLGDAAARCGCRAAEIAACLSGEASSAGGCGWRIVREPGGQREIPLICVETGEAFPNAAAASKRAGCSRQTIGNCAAGRSRTAGGYHWAYAEQPPESWRAAIECPEAAAEFESLGDAAEWAGCEAAEIADCLAGRKDAAGGGRWRFRKLRGGRRTMPIVCVETGDEFPSIRAAEERTGCCHGTISAVLSGRSKTAGGHRWAYAGQREPSWKTPVACLDPQMTFPGVKEAAAWAGCNPGCISAVLAGRAKTAGGRRWTYAETDAAGNAADE